jgi:integrase
MAELKAWLGSDRLQAFDGEKAAAWRSDLLKDSGSLGAAKRKIGLVRACLQAAMDGDLPVHKATIEALNTRSLRESSGTRVLRQAFSKTQAGLLWHVSRNQRGPRPLDRWAIPLGLSLGCRLEELAGIRQEDVKEIDGIPVVVIQPSEDRRLKNDSSARTIPIPLALVKEGFVEWAKQQPEGLLFPEPPPPPTDPRLSHYASIRLGKLIRQQAGITDPALVFHCCRHTTAQQLVDAGVEQRLIEAVMGHTSKSMTARYSRQGPPMQLIAEALEQRDWSWVPETP